MAVYLIACGDTGMVKIGMADDPLNRLRFLQTAHFEPLRMLKTWDGGIAEEAAMQRAFSEYHVRGEWFRFTEAMLKADPALLVIPVAPIKRPEPEITDPVLTKIEAFLVSQQMTATRFGMHAANDPQLVHELRKGRELRRATLTRILKFIAQGSMA